MPRWMLKDSKVYSCGRRPRVRDWTAVCRLADQHGGAPTRITTANIGVAWNLDPHAPVATVYKGPNGIFPDDARQFWPAKEQLEADIIRFQEACARAAERSQRRARELTQAIE